MKNLITRALTGLVFVLVIVGSIIYSPYSFIALFAIVTGFLLSEFYGLMKQHQGINLKVAYHTAGGMVLFVSTALFAADVCNENVFLVYLLYLLGMFVSELYRKRPEPIKNVAYALMGQMYIALPFALLNMIGFNEADGVVAYSWIPLLAMFVFIWTNDTGAYLVGSMIGKRKLFERISPKKSWEGFYGGIVFVLAASWIFYMSVGYMSLAQWMGMGIVTSVFSTWGDLTESLIKRTIGVKDSGNMLPGHGGFLDRFDSVLLAAPAVVIYLGVLAVLR